MVVGGVWNRFLWRATLVVLGITLGVGLLSVALVERVASRWELARQREAIETQVDGVESLASAACFVEDRNLAAQIVHGLVSTRNVQSATLRSHNQVLAAASREGGAPAADAPVLTRRIPSPFFKEVQVGELLLATDPAEAMRLVARTAALLRTMVFGLAVTLAAAVAYAIQAAIVRPVDLVAERLGRLDANHGDRLTVPSGHEKDEIGHLVREVNGALERAANPVVVGQKVLLRDPVTGILNRLGAEQALAARSARGGGLGLMLVALELAKQVSEQYGDGADDEVLRQASRRMGANLRRLDLVAHLGGPDFLIILDSVADEAEAVAMAKQIISAINAPIPLPGGGQAQVAACAGIVLPDAGEIPSRLPMLKRADLALCQARLAGPNQCMVFRA